MKTNAFPIETYGEAVSAVVERLLFLAGCCISGIGVPSERFLSESFFDKSIYLFFFLDSPPPH